MTFGFLDLPEWEVGTLLIWRLRLVLCMCDGTLHICVLLQSEHLTGEGGDFSVRTLSISLRYAIISKLCCVFTIKKHREVPGGKGFTGS